MTLHILVVHAGIIVVQRSKVVMCQVYSSHVIRELQGMVEYLNNGKISG